MTTAKELLKLIETAHPNDAAKLDEIDEAVMLYVFSDLEFWKIGDEYLCNGNKVLREQYTRSRDALKAIRPEVFRPSIEQQGDVWLSRAFVKSGMIKFTKLLPTEELSELHTIIMAWALERGEEI